MEMHEKVRLSLAGYVGRKALGSHFAALRLGQEAGRAEVAGLTL